MFDDRMAALEAEYHAVEAELADPATLGDAVPAFASRLAIGEPPAPLPMMTRSNWVLTANPPRW